MFVKTNKKSRCSTSTINYVVNYFNIFMKLKARIRDRKSYETLNYYRICNENSFYEACTRNIQQRNKFYLSIISTLLTS